MMRKSLVQRFKRLDAYAKPLDDVRVRTKTGALVTFVCGSIILLLTCLELLRYLTPVMQPEIVVDGGKMENLPINFNITFPHLPCYLLGLDIMDESGAKVTDFQHNVFKIRLDKTGKVLEREKKKDLSAAAGNALVANQQFSDNYCGPCYGATRKDGSTCCNTCDDVRNAYAGMGWGLPEVEKVEQCLRERAQSQAEEGCNMNGQLLVKKIRANFHFSSGRSGDYGGTHVHDTHTYLANNHDFSHSIHHLGFGDQSPEQYKQKRTVIEALNNPLDNTSWENREVAMMYQYFLKIVPTHFEFLNGKSLRTYQYSVTRNTRNVLRNSGGLPGVFFTMDFSPMVVVYSEYRPSLGTFLTGLCAIVGGMFTVAQLIDYYLYTASQSSSAKRRTRGPE